MPDGKLPAAILSFFERSTRKISSLYRPIWLVSELHEAVWVVNAGPDVRDVAGTIKGGTRLSWKRMLPGGRFSSPVYSVPLEQAKMLIVWAHDGAVLSGTGSIRSIDHFHIYLLWLVEFLAIRYGERFQCEGFAVMGIDDIIEFLEASEESGSCGTGDYIRRWESYLLRHFDISLEPLETTLSNLAEIGAYGDDGKLDFKYIASAIEIDSRRLSTSSAFKQYAEKYSAQSFSSIDIKEEPPRCTNNLATWIVKFCAVLSSLPIKSCAELDDNRLVLDAVRPFRGKNDNRTKTLPLAVGRDLTAGCCRWIMHTYPAFREYLRSTVALSKELMNNPKISVFTALSSSERLVPLPSELEQSLNKFKRMQSDNCVVGEKVRTHFPFTIFLFRQHVAVCFCLVTMLACCRRSEVVDLKTMSTRDLDGRFYLSVLLRKTGDGSVRQKMEKPVPRLVHECLETLAELKSVWRLIVSSDDPLFDQQVFYKVNARGAFPLAVQDTYEIVRELSEFLGLACRNGQRWFVLPHQLRRYFAMTFFHFGGAENSLPALSWFMGHDNIEQTWRYIKESLTGKELSASEAALATSAVCSNDQSTGVELLRNIVLKHFGCDRINVMHEDELRDYLELLAERGVYTATPVQIMSGKRRMYTVLISIRGQDRAQTN